MTKVSDLARERMDQLRDSLSDAVATTSAQVQDTVTSVTDKVASMTECFDSLKTVTHQPQPISTTL